MRHTATPTDPEARDSNGRRLSTCAQCQRPVRRISILRGGYYPGTGAVWAKVGAERRIEWRHLPEPKAVK